MRTFTARDPLAQSFEILKSDYPNGLFLSSCDIFFASKDVDVPVTLDIRRVSLGIPTKVIVPLSSVTLVPDQINTSNDGTTATTFTFPSPVYIEPGEYAIVLQTNTDKYNVYVSVLGEVDLSSGNRITKQPFGGSLFKSQNASTWTPEQFKDLKFVLRRCSFSTGSGTVDFLSKQYAAFQRYSLLRTLSQEYIPGEPASISYQVKTRSVSSNTVGSFTDFVSNQNFEFPEVKRINPSANSEVTVRATLSTTDEYISPVIDSTRFGAVVVRNIVNNLSTGETTARGGNALGKYITRRVDLAEGFDASTLKVFLNVSRPAATDIKVYYKVLSKYDNTDFADRPYVEMSKVDLGGSSTTGVNTFIEEQYLAEDITYTGTAGAGGKYTDFKSFAIKVVFLSSDEAFVPKISSLRAVALS